MLKIRASEKSSAIGERGDYRRQTENALKAHERVKSMRPRPSPMVSFGFSSCISVSKIDICQIVLEGFPPRLPSGDFLHI
jgi:hypothetical protein